jgi:hypothetical protein
MTARQRARMVASAVCPPRAPNLLTIEGKGEGAKNPCNRRAHDRRFNQIFTRGKLKGGVSRPGGNHVDCRTQAVAGKCAYAQWQPEQVARRRPARRRQS